MKDHKGCYRAFHWSNKAWYVDRKGNPSITFGMFHKDGGTSGEMTVEWINLGGKTTPQLLCFDDAWSALGLFTDLIMKMAEVDSEDISQECFVKILKECNFKDITVYKDPYRDDARERLNMKIKKYKEELKEAEWESNNL